MKKLAFLTLLLVFLAMPVWADETKILVIEATNGARGELTEKEGQLHFEGKADESARIFFDYLIQYYQELSPEEKTCIKKGIQR